MLLEGRAVPAARYIAPYVQTPLDVVDRMLDLAVIGAGDVLYDLGAGDGRIVLAASATYGIRAVGYEIDPDLVADARESIGRAGVGHLAEIRAHDILAADLSGATVFTVYLTPGANVRLRPRILAHAPRGARVVSHEFGMGVWRPAQVERMHDAHGVPHTLYLWRL
jgi:hypothetical protein